MEFVHYMFLPFHRYFDFSGRSGRREFWAYTVLILILDTASRLLDLIFFNGESVFNAIQIALCAIPWLSLSVRRFHDLNRPGWQLVFYFLVPLALFSVGMFIVEKTVLPVVGPLFITLSVVGMIYPAYLMYVRAGDYGPNRWGDILF